MDSVKRLTLDRYEHGLLVRALYEEWKKMLNVGTDTADIEDLLLRVIDAPTKNDLGGIDYERNHLSPRGRLFNPRH